MKILGDIMGNSNYLITLITMKRNLIRNKGVFPNQTSWTIKQPSLNLLLAKAIST